MAFRALVVEIDFTRAQVVFAEVDPEDRLHKILGGEIKLGTFSNDARESLLAVLGCRTFRGKVKIVLLV